MSDTPETDAQLTTFTSISKLKKHFVNRTGTASAEFTRKLERERNEAREALRAVYSAGCELKRHVTAYVMNYREISGPNATEALEQYHDATRNLAKIMGEENAK